MLEFSIFVQKESYQSFRNRKARGNQTGVSSPENQNSTFNLILHQSLLSKYFDNNAQSGWLL